MGRSSIPTLREYVDRIIESDDKQPIIDEACRHYSTVELWCWNAELGEDAAVGFSWNSAKDDISRSHIFWNRFYAPSASKDAFLDRLGEMHLEIDETVRLYVQKYGELDEQGRQLVATTKEKLKPRLKLEQKLIQPTVEAFVEYLEWESIENYREGIFKRAAAAFPQDERIWHRWIQSYVRDEKNYIELLRKAELICDCPSIQATKILLTGEGSAQTSEQRIAFLCFLLSKLYNEPDEDQNHLTLIASSYVRASRDPEFIGYVQAVLTIVDKDIAEPLWVLKNDEMYREWFHCKLLSLVPDVAEYFEPILKLREETPAILKEQLRGYLVLGMALEVDVTFMKLRELSTSPAAGHTDAQKPWAPGARNRESTSLIVSGPTTKEQLYERLDKSQIVSSQHYDSYHVLEMATEREKNVAIATLTFSQKIPGTVAYDAKETTLWVTNYKSTWDKAELHEVFGKYGELLAVRLPQTQGRRFCYVQYSSSHEAINAMQQIPKEYPDIVIKLSDPSARKNRSGAVEDGRMVYVSGFDFAATIDQVKVWIITHSLYSPSNISIPASSLGREHDGYAFVEYTSPEQAKAAMEQLNTLDHGGRRIRASISRKKRRFENPNVLVVENVYDEASLKALVDGTVKYNEQTHTAQILFETQQDVGRAMLKLQGRELAGKLLKVKADLKPRNVRR